MWKFVSGALGAVLIVIVTFVVAQQIKLPGGGSSTTASPTTAAPTSTSAGAATTTTTIPKPTEVGMAVVKATDLVEAKRQALVAIPADQIATVESAKAEYTQARALLVDTQNAALPQPSMMLSWVQLAISIAMMIFMIIVVVVILRSQPPKAKPQLASSTPPRRQTAPKPPAAPVPPVPPTPPASPKHRRSSSSWKGEGDYYRRVMALDLPDEQKGAIWEARREFTPGRESECAEALFAELEAAQAASLTS